MPSAPRTSVQTRLTLTILAAILLSWVLSAGVANYFAYLELRAAWRTMIQSPDLYPRPIPEPRFGVREFLLSPLRVTLLGVRPQRGPEPPRPVPQGPGRPPIGPPPPRPDLIRAEIAAAIARGLLVLALGLAAGAWLSRRFTGPLGELAEGAGQFRSGNYDHRVKADGSDEFSDVAEAMNQMAEHVAGHIASLEHEAERRRQFLVDVAHELRSPVATIRTMAGALEDGVAGTAERRERAVEALARTSERLQRLVDDLMMLARLDLNELPLDKKPEDVWHLIKEAVQAQAASAEEAGVAVRMDGSDERIIASIDRDRFGQVIDNVLGNAISYAGPGSEVLISVQVGNLARVTVSDNGRGIPSEHLDRIFEPFYRADAARTPDDAHSGLGLRIARGLVEAHGGTLEITSAENAGTTVTITLP